MDPKMYLAENVLNERRTVTYRKACVSWRKKTSTHACYLGFSLNFIAAKMPRGLKASTQHTSFPDSKSRQSPPATNGHAKDEDEVMQSSPYLPSSMPNPDSSPDSSRVSSIIIAREEDLEDAKSTFQSISTIQIYSLQPDVLQDLNTLTDVCREVATAHAQDDPLECGAQWGMIQNRKVKPKSEASVPAKRPLQKEEAPAKPTPKTEEQRQPTSGSESQSSAKPATKAPAPKREKSNLFNSFAKAKPKQKTATPTESVRVTHAVYLDGQSTRSETSYNSLHIAVVLDDASEDEQEELFPDFKDKSGDKAASANRESKKEREEKLKQMMEDEDADGMIPSSRRLSEWIPYASTDEEMPDADDEPQREPTPVEPSPPSKPIELKEEATSQGGRRRGKRQVMKKRTVKDEEGYLVTREEPTWESFSEDEPAPVKKKTAGNVPKGKGAKPGQGNIMSFFGKNAVSGRDSSALAKRACPDYTSYAAKPHGPYSEGPLKLPFQRPAEACRTFSSSAVEKVIDDMTSRLVDKDLAQLFRNAFPNTLDTTIKWHVNGSSPTSSKRNVRRDGSDWSGAQTFIVTGDINAEWLRDSTNQLTNYHKLTGQDKNLYTLILGAINTQAEFVIQSPYCNAFQPPSISGVKPENNTQQDIVRPPYSRSFVYECKYELDSLAHFLMLGTEFHENTGSTEFLTDRWFMALNTVLRVIDAESLPTFNSENQFVTNQYTFQRKTNIGTETLNLQGVGNPLNSETGLIRSAFRPSDDATILGFFIPPNAMMAVQLQKIAKVVKKAGGHDDLAVKLEQRGKKLAAAVREHGIVNHAKYGDVYAFEVDGYGSRILMDDANIPSLLSLPYLGFLDKSDEVYQNTRKMITDKAGNPYYLEGPEFHGIGGPHIGLENAWPMSLLMQAQTSDNDTEIMKSINLVRDSSLLGLVHESIDVTNITAYTRPWFSWANSVFSQTLLKVAAERPHLIFGEGAEPYNI
ncbi:Six-hairpin glycosidase [Penicillium argentinense]|uniref:Six-hairpin glycosidase n=1 Tax=Penicillium argentinense TaxID=1131581 RepID=A0A9W9FD94_9EURO|nr:Six-hairpin glycosidase [Penicillium argentinense]KAJ5098091.1 Six-hairpin glycosidase [Penicillium argentinense]